MQNISGKHFVAWPATLVVLLAIDALWLGVIASARWRPAGITALRWFASRYAG